MSKVISRLRWVCFTAVCDRLAKLAPFSQPMGSQTQTNCDLLARVFPRLPRRVLASNSDWFIALFTSVLIGQSNYFDFGLRHSIKNRSIVQRYHIFKLKLCNFSLTTEGDRNMFFKIRHKVFFLKILPSVCKHTGQ